jgi:hypothetical protein
LPVRSKEVSEFGDALLQLGQTVGEIRHGEDSGGGDNMQRAARPPLADERPPTVCKIRGRTPGKKCRGKK